MKNLIKKVWIVLVFLLLMVAMTPTVMADAEDVPAQSSLWEDIKAAGSGIYQGAKEKAPGWWESIKGTASDVVGTIKENGPGWVEGAKEKGQEVIDKGKDVIQGAQEQASEFLDDQQNEFWERTEQQINGDSAGSDGSSSLEAQQDEFWENIAQIMGDGSGDKLTAASEETPPEAETTSLKSHTANDADLKANLVAEDGAADPVKSNPTASLVDVRPEAKVAAGQPSSQEAEHPEGLETATKKSVEVPLESIPWLVVAVFWLLWIAHLPRKRDRR